MNQPTSHRIESIDLLRGIVIVIMALDHVRDYFHADAYLYSPTDLSKATTTLFFTRWITHFCAPVFVFLAGTSAFQIGLKKGKSELSAFLVKRGLWLIILEFTIINVGWFFNFQFSFFALTVIWVLGVGMIVLAGLIYLPLKGILGIAALLILGHNALDSIHIPGQSILSVSWSLVHDPQMFTWGKDRFLFVGYNFIPWIAVMALGYCFGSLYIPAVDAAKRKRILFQLGSLAVLFFILLRGFNEYGDPQPWSVQSSLMMTLASFLNTNKYPASLLYLLMTLGPATLFLAITEKITAKFAKPLIIIGRVPLFFYVIHIYAAHLLALAAAMFTGFPVSSMVFTTWITNSPKLKGYGFGLMTVYTIWIIIVLGLYPLCKSFELYKRSNKTKWWLSYL